MNDISTAVMNIAEKHFDNFKVRNGQVTTEFCPFCGGGDSLDRYTFAVGLHNGAYQCLRGSCGKKGGFRDLCEFFGERNVEEVGIPVARKQMKTEYKKPDPTLYSRELTDEIETYFAKRRISEDTLKAFDIMRSTENNIVFPFYRDDVLTFVKFRKPAVGTQYEEVVVNGQKVLDEKGEPKKRKLPKEWQIPDTEQILFGMQNVAFNKPLIICEGEIDCLSIYEAGFHNVVSVPSGVNNMDWVENCYDWLENFQEIFLFGDNDIPGIEMMNVLCKRLGEERCMLPGEYPEAVKDGKDFERLCKDANEILLCYGPEGIRRVMDGFKPTPVKGILNLADVPFVDPTTVPRIYTPIKGLNKLIGGLGEGSLTVFTGKRGNGKSTLNGQILLNAIQQGYKAAAYSGELSSSKFLEWIFMQATERRFIGVKADAAAEKLYGVVSPKIQKRIREWIDNKFFLFDNSQVDDANQQEAIIKVFTTCAKRYGCKIFLVDNMMTAVNMDEDENKAQAHLASALKAFAVKYKAAVILVA